MFTRFVPIALLLALAFAAGAILTGRLQSRDVAGAPGSAQRARSATQASTPQPPASGLPDLTQIAARTAPAVVNISSVQLVRPRAPFRDPFFERFFGDELYPPQRGESAGSGVIVSPDGYVLTNNHVIGENLQNVQKVTVILTDRREREAKLVGIDPLTDLALLKIEEENLPTIPWGDSSGLRVAEWVLAIGNPYQLGQTVTFGIVSGVNRSYGEISALVDYIQTDAAINQGNSGGALINRRGELVGINTWIVSESGGNQGIGFAIPANLARNISQQLAKHGEVRRGSIGVGQLAPITPALASDLHLPDARGALVWSLYRSSAAYRAGLRPGDVIVSVDGVRVDDPAHAQRALLEAPIGSIVRLGIVRDGRQQEIRVQVENQSTRARRNAA
jgi:Do/DeqQ family serine protease